MNIWACLDRSAEGLGSSVGGVSSCGNAVVLDSADVLADMLIGECPSTAVTDGTWGSCSEITWQQAQNVSGTSSIGAADGSLVLVSSFSWSFSSSSSSTSSETTTTGVLPVLSESDGYQIAYAIVGLWVVAYVFKSFRRAIQKR